MASDFRNELDFCESGKQTSPFDCDALKGMSGSRSDHYTKLAKGSWDRMDKRIHTFTQSLNFQAACIQLKV